MKTREEFKRQLWCDVYLAQTKLCENAKTCAERATQAVMDFHSTTVL